MSDMAPSISSFCESADNSWVRCLTEDPESGANFPNRASREVRSGHFVKVPPTPLRDPFLVLHSAPCYDHFLKTPLKNSNCAQLLGTGLGLR